MEQDISLALCCLHSVWAVYILVTHDRGGLLAFNATLTIARIYELLKPLSVIVSLWNRFGISCIKVKQVFKGDFCTHRAPVFIALLIFIDSPLTP
jgi:hypothetical protein